MMNDPLAATERLPSIRQFLEQVMTDLEGGLNVVLLLPPGVEADAINDRLAEMLSQRDRSVVPFDAAALPCVPTNPRDLLCAALGGHIAAGSSFQVMLEQGACPDTLLVTGIARLSAEQRRAWLRLVRRWSQEVRGVAVQQRPAHALCLIEPAQAVVHDLPESDVRLVLRWWWGFPSSIELRALCRSTTGSGPRATWLETLIAGVAPGDALLADHLWTECPATLEELREVLARFGQRHGLKDEAPDGLSPFCAGIAGLHADISDGPPPLRRRQWASGGLIGSPEFGPEPHPAILAARNERKRLEHLVWRGQQQVLLPIIDQARLGCCLELRRELGKSWHRRHAIVAEGPDDERRLEEDPLSAELPFLRAVLRQAVRGADGAALRSWLPIMDQVVRVRNELAHYRALDLRGLTAFWTELCRGAGRN